jgi:hypothetical protein
VAPIKHRDAYASDEDIAETRPRSVVSKRILAEIARDEGGDIVKAASGDPVAEVQKLIDRPALLARRKRGRPSVWHSNRAGS